MCSEIFGSVLFLNFISTLNVNDKNVWIISLM